METPTKPRGVRVEIPTPVREQFIRDALEASKEGGSLPHGFIRDYSRKLGCCRSSLHRVLQRYRKDLSERSSVEEPVSIARKRKGRCGRKRKAEQERIEAIRDVPLPKRRTQGLMSATSGVPQTTLRRIMKREGYKRRSSFMKPLLTDENKAARVSWALSHINETDRGYALRHAPQFVDFYDEVHIDEKWFYLCKDKTKFWLTEDEKLPNHTVKSKNFVLESDVSRCCRSSALCAWNA